MKINLEMFIAILTLLFINVHGERSVAFVIDDSYSMNDEIEQVKMQTEQLFEAVFESEESKFNNYVLVTFNDPSSEVRIITNYSQQFKKYLSTNINLKGNLDCPEMAMLGILNAINSCPSNSVIYVFTDAAAKDYYKFEEVKSLSLKKSIQITFLLTGICDTSLTSEEYVAYYKLAEATSGQVFHLSESNIDKVISYISESIKSEKYLLADCLATDCPISLSFDVDSKTSNVMISVSKIGEVIESDKITSNMSLQVLDSGNNIIKYDFIMNSKYIMIVKLHEIKPGLYKAKLDCNHDGLRTYMAVKGTTSISFVHGFSKDKPSSLEETSTLPLPGDKTFLAIALDNPKRKYIILDMIELIDVNNTIIHTAIALGLVDAQKQFYVTEKINIPDKMFKIKVHGHTKAEEKVARLGKTFIEPQKSFGNITDKSPKVTIIGDTEIITEPNTPVTFKCSVEAYPKPEIVWEKDNGDKFHTEVITVELTGHYKSVLQIKESNSATYYCIAKNTIGNAKAYAKITIIEKLPLIEDTKINVSSLEGNIIEIPCNVIQGYPLPSVEWFRNNIKIINGRKYNILEDHTLKFRAEVSDNGVFTCEAKNNAGHYKKHTNVTVYELPLIEDTKINVSSLEGNIIEIPCNVIQGYPLPSVEWFRNNIKIINGRKYNILEDHTLKFRAEVSDNGVFTCEAKNNAGHYKKHTNVTVYEQPFIENSNKYVFTLKGRVTEIPCNVIKGYPPPSVEWFRKNIKISNGRKYQILEDHTLRFRADVSDHEIFVCKATNDYGHYKKKVYVEIRVKPAIKNAGKDVNIAAQKEVNLECLVTGFPKPEVRWLNNSEYIESGSKVQMFRDHKLRFKATIFDTSNYTCEAKNSVGEDKITFHVNVYEPAEVALPRKTNYTIDLGTPLSLACSAANGYPKPHVELFHLPNDKKSRLSPLILKNKKYKLQRAKRTDGGYYMCSAKNDYSLSNFTYTVDIQEKPQIDKTTASEYYSAIEGDPSLVIPCNAGGNPKPSFTWIWNGGVYVPNPFESNNGTLVLKNPVSNMSGSYVCEANNTIGRDTHHVDVTILPYPELMPGPNDVIRPDVTLHEGIRSTVPCINKPLKHMDHVRWYKDQKLISREKILIINPSVSDNGKYIICRVSYENYTSVSYYTNVVVKS